MFIIKNGAALTTCLKNSMFEGSIGFVPTMGALHEGHLSLIKKSKAQNGFTVCSIFINPTQFNNLTDFEKYPVTLEKDIDLLEQSGCDCLFLPSIHEIYPPGYQAPHYAITELEAVFEGSYRPGHFQGVCQVVHRLLNLVAPDKLYLGEKDFQQCMVIKKLIRLLNIPVVVIVCATLREADGLAMSSRNMRLSEEDRRKAPYIYQTLLQIANSFNAQSLLPSLKKELEEKGFKIDYLDVADADNLSAISETTTRKVALIAAFIGEVRLIDNIVF